jgi:hypothetical protein
MGWALVWSLACFAVFENPRGEVWNMKKTERVRQLVSGSIGVEDLKLQSEKGWKLVALEWEREVDAAEAGATPQVGAAQVDAAVGPLPAEVPFGLQIAPETRRLEENPTEREILFQLMELIVEDGSYARIADEINRRGFRTRQGAKWSPVSVFEMLPRLIEVGPHVFQSPEWQKRKQHLTEGAVR